MMNWTKSVLCSLALLAATSSNIAWADHPHFYHGPRWGVGLYVNPFPIVRSSYYYGSPYYYPTTYRYYPEVVVAPVVTTVPQTVYIEQSYSGPAVTSTSSGTTTYVSPSVPQQGNGDWYYCHNPDGFYPAIKSCPSGWQRVPAQVPADR
ncbi:hypothetical protein ACO0K3_00605 [Undibacterium sp. Rencai35W]|uniref:hypothetical protein n=1 Tax=Undibacterium sp. Rencai35W TaxID=3413046 RepID=UPI003BEF5D6D